MKREELNEHLVGVASYPMRVRGLKLAGTHPASVRIGRTLCGCVD